MLKDEVLKLLKSSNSYISGQKICELLKVSRTAIWNSINVLKEEGYKIESTTNKGYKLISNFDILNEIELIEEFENKNIDIKLVYEDSIDSTNSYAKRRSDEFKDQDAIFIAGEQTRGRGRRTRIWDSPKDTGIWLSLLLHPKIESHKASMITLVAALAVVKSLKDIVPKLGIKWPNDIVLSKKKVCGILTEMSADMDGIKYVICGIGINVNTKSFKPELENLASSLYIETGKEYIRKEIISTLVKEFYLLYEEFVKVGDLSFLLDEYNKYLLGNNEDITIIGLKDRYEAKQLGINNLGELIIEKKDKSIDILISGEISIRGLYTYE